MRFIFKKIPASNGQKRSNQIVPRNKLKGGAASVKFGIRELRKLASQAKIPNRQRMSKEELAEALDRYYAAARILIAWRTSRHRRSANSSNPPVTGPTIANNRSSSGEIIDPITLEPLQPPIWTYSLDCGKSVHYSLENLIQYLVCSKNFVDPITALPFADRHLRELDDAARLYQIRAPSLLLLSRSNQPQQHRIEQSLITGLERVAGDYIEKFRKMIEMEPPYLDKQRTAEEFNLRMHKEFLDVFRHLYATDPETATICIKQWCQFLEGPPTNPTQDPARFKAPLINWLTSLCVQ